MTHKAVSAEADDSYQRFKWEVAAIAAFEDEQGLWEPLWYANSLYPERQQDEREKLAERALRELFADGLIVSIASLPRGGTSTSDPLSALLSRERIRAAKPCRARCQRMPG